MGPHHGDLRRGDKICWFYCSHTNSNKGPVSSLLLTITASEEIIELTPAVLEAPSKLAFRFSQFQTVQGSTVYLGLYLYKRVKSVKNTARAVVIALDFNRHS